MTTSSKRSEGRLRDGQVDGCGRSPLPTPPKRILAVFQPHRYSRTQEFLNDFAQALQNCDVLLIAPIYSAGEQPLEGVSSHNLADEVRRLNPDLPVLVANTLDELAEQVQTESLVDDLVLAMGAGDVNSLWSRLSRSEQTNHASAAVTA